MKRESHTAVWRGALLEDKENISLFNSLTHTSSTNRYLELNKVIKNIRTQKLVCYFSI